MSPFGDFPELGKLNSNVEEYEHPAAEAAEARDILAEDERDRPFPSLYVLATFVGLLLVGRLLNLQIMEGGKNRLLAEGNRIRNREIPAPRGIIEDRNGTVLATNGAEFNLELFPADLPHDKASREALYTKIQAVVGYDPVALRSQIDQNGLYSLEPITLKENLSAEEAITDQLEFADHSGISVSKIPNREYSSIPSLGHILGYTGKLTRQEADKHPDYSLASQIGKTGLEKIYDQFLRGQDGQERVEVDSRGRIQRFLAQKPAEVGKTLALSLDAPLQAEMTKVLEAQAGSGKDAKNAVALAMDPRNGEILGMVSLPDYDNNLFAHGVQQADFDQLLNDPNTPLLNRAIAGIYPSGSVIKPVIATAALEEKVISDQTVIDTSAGEIRIGQWVFPDWRVHGRADVKQAIAESNDVFFYTLGGGWGKIAGLGVRRLSDYLNRFGFGAKTGIDLPGEEQGLVPDEAWKKRVEKEAWYIGDTYHMSIGQGFFLATPLQILNATSAIANGGTLYKPHLVREVRDQDKVVERPFENAILRQDLASASTLATVRAGMRLAVTGGTARVLNDLPVPVAGKTGTAQFGTDKKTHSWFTAFAPFDNPTIALIVLVEGGGEGNEAALPAAKEILQYYFTRP